MLASIYTGALKYRTDNPSLPSSICIPNPLQIVWCLNKICMWWWKLSQIFCFKNQTIYFIQRHEIDYTWLLCGIVIDYHEALITLINKLNSMCLPLWVKIQRIWLHSSFIHQPNYIFKIPCYSVNFVIQKQLKSVYNIYSGISVFHSIENLLSVLFNLGNLSIGFIRRIQANDNWVS